MKEFFQKEFLGQSQTAFPLIQSLRKKGMERFAALDLPTTNDESWKYTSLDRLKKVSFKNQSQQVPIVSRARLNQAALKLLDGICLVFVNGRYSESLSSVHQTNGVVVQNLRMANASHAALLEKHLGHYVDLKNSFMALNTAFLSEGAFVYLPPATVLKDPIHLLFVSTEETEGMVTHPRTLVVADQGSEATIIEGYIGLGRSAYWTNATTEVVLGENSNVDHYKVQLESETAFHLGTFQVQQHAQSRLTSHVISLGGGLCRNEVNTVLNAEGAECILNGLYIGSNHQHVDNQTSIDHAKPHGTSDELYKGILSGHAEAVFNGKIIVRPDAQKTVSRQTNRNLLLSKEALVNTKPLLEIFANDVKCNHGATIGRLDEQALFYLRSRGLGSDEARSLLTIAFAQELIDRVRVPSLKGALHEWVMSRLLEGSFCV